MGALPRCSPDVPNGYDSIADRAWRHPPSVVVAATFALMLVPFLLVEQFPSPFFRVFPVSSYLVFHNVAEGLSLIVSFSIFGVGWFTYAQSKDRHALFLSAAFLGIGFMDFMHVLSYSGMPGFITPNSANKSTQFWIAARLFCALALLVSAHITPGISNRWLSKWNLAAAVLAVSGAVFTGIVYFPSHVPTTFAEGVGLTPFKAYSEFLIIVLLLAAAASYWNRISKTGERQLNPYIAACLINVFSELCFSDYVSVFDTFNVIGHLYKVAAFLLIYSVVFISSVRNPYRKQEILVEELTQENVQRIKAEAEARELESKYRLLVAQAGEAIFIAQDETVKFPNPRSLEMTGYSAEELAGVPFSALIHPEDRTSVLERYIGRLRGGPAFEPIPFRILRKTGEEIWTQGTAERVDWGGRPGVLCFLRDITKERNLEAQIRQSQKMEAMGRMAGGIAHDFNNLLTVIYGYCDLALARIGAVAPVRHSLEEIRSATDRCAALTRQILAFSRKQVLAPRVISLADVVAGMDNLLRRLVGEDIELVSVRGKDLGNVKADPGQIEQLIVNLVVNSRDAMPGGGKLIVETANVVLDERSVCGHQHVLPGYYVMLAVSDTGYGMDEGMVERIFEPFFTMKEGGTGLGLSTVYGIVMQSGGHITVRSTPGVGTTFKIYFPHVEETVTRISRPAALRLDDLRGGETALVVEDETPVREMIREILEHYGYGVLEARSGAEAIDLCSRHKGTIHLVLTDVVMPGMSGVELSNRLATLQPGMKVLFMSGFSANAIAHQGIPATETPFIHKPFTMTALAQKVREVLVSGSATAGSSADLETASPSP